MAVGTQLVNFGPRAEINFYLKRGRQMGKSLITANTQQTDFGLIAASKRTAISRVVVE